MSPVNYWQQEGEIFAWYYSDGSKNYRGWHLTASDTGANSICLLLKAFLEEADFRHRKVSLSPVTPDILEVPNYRKKADWARSLELVYNPNTEHSSQWKLEKEGDALTLGLGQTSLNELLEAFKGLPKGEGDYRIGPTDEKADDDQFIWIWWHPSTRLRSGV